MSKDRGKWMPQLRWRANLPFLCLSIQFTPSVNWMIPTNTEVDLDSAYSCQCTSLPESLTNTRGSILSASLSPVKFKQKVNHHSKQHFKTSGQKESLVEKKN